jgi:hypothetical protein
MCIEYHDPWFTRDRDIEYRARGWRGDGGNDALGGLLDVELLVGAAGAAQGTGADGNPGSGAGGGRGIGVGVGVQC